MRLLRIAASIAALAIASLQAPPVSAANLFFSAFGSGSSCSQSSPCSLATAIATAGNEFSQIELACSDNSSSGTGNEVVSVASLIIDCAGTTGSLNGLTISSSSVTLRNLTITATNTALNLENGMLTLENLHIAASTVNAILSQPNSPSVLIVKNCLIDFGSAAVLLKPNAGGSLSASFDHVIISNNAGGGIKVDTTNGTVTVDITDSVFRNNAGNAVNVVGGAGGQAMVSIKNSVIAKNGGAGVQANGATSGVLVQTTLLDQNASGATSIVNNGHISTYGNNSIVGNGGSGFNGTAPLQ
jgi:hypothetical protein